MRMPVRLTAALALVLLGGCVNPFKPATPERPTGGIVVDENFSSPQSLLETMASAVAAKSDGAIAYENALSADFTATEPLAVRTLFRVLPEGSWNRNLEVNNLFPTLASLRPKAYQMSFWRDNTLAADDAPVGGSSAVLYRYYEVYAVGDVQAENDTIAIGWAKLTLDLPEGGSRWYLTKWDDNFRPELGPQPANTSFMSMGFRRLDSYSFP